jgi:hypothetical protein
VEKVEYPAEEYGYPAEEDGYPAEEDEKASWFEENPAESIAKLHPSESPCS